MTRNATALLSCSLAALAFAAHKNPLPASAALLWGSASLCLAAAVRMLGGEWHIAEGGSLNKPAIALGAVTVLVLRPGRFVEPVAEIALIATAAVLTALGQGGKIDAAARAVWSRLVDAPKLPGDQVLHGMIVGVVISLPLGGSITTPGDLGVARVMAALGALVGPWLAGAAERPPEAWLPHAISELGPVLPDDLPPVDQAAAAPGPEASAPKIRRKRAAPPPPETPVPVEPAPVPPAPEAPAPEAPAPEAPAPEAPAPESTPANSKPKPRLAFKITKPRTDV